MYTLRSTYARSYTYKSTITMDTKLQLVPYKVNHRIWETLYFMTNEFKCILTRVHCFTNTHD